MFSRDILENRNGKLKKSDWILIVCSWLLIQIIVCYFLGIRDQEEAVKYIGLADKWMKGDRNFSLYNLFYSGYVSIFVLLRSFGLPFKSMYVVQLLFSLLAVYFFIKILCLYIQSRFAIVVSAILYATCYIIQQWVSALFTDSIFSDLLIIATYFLLTEKNGTGNKWLFWILLFILPLFRPVGFLFIPVACLYWLTFNPRKNISRLLVCMGYLLLIGLVVYKTFGHDEPYYYPIHSLHNIQANVICGYPGDLLKYATIPYQEGMSVFSFLYHNPGMTCRLFLLRTYKIFSMGRPYFSSVHNLLLFITTFFYYTSAIIGTIDIFRRKENKYYFLIAGVLIFSFPMIIFCVEWTGRLSLPVLNFVLLLSGIGIDRIRRSSNFLPPVRHDALQQ
jgi:hypothetical protein